MTESHPVQFYKPQPDGSGAVVATALPDATRLEPSTCVEAEPFALQVLDDSMQPEFRKGCIILIDPTGRATDGSFVLARVGVSETSHTNNPDSRTPELENYLFRQLIKTVDDGWALRPFNAEWGDDKQPCELSDVVGVIVQRAGVRRRYHKRYD